jgi:hypothetical protein
LRAGGASRLSHCPGARVPSFVHNILWVGWLTKWPMGRQFFACRIGEAPILFARKKCVVEVNE